MRLVKDFSVIIREIVRYCTSKELNTLSAGKVHALGKWLLLNCSSYFLAYDSADKKLPNSRDGKCVHLIESFWVRVELDFF